MPSAPKSGSTSVVSVQVKFPRELLAQIEHVKHQRQVCARSRRVFTREEMERLKLRAKSEGEAAAKNEANQLYREKLANHVNEQHVSRVSVILLLIAEGLKTLPAFPERYDIEQILAALK